MTRSEGIRHTITTRSTATTVQVIETKRSPPIWSVKVDYHYRKSFIGPDARTNAEAYAAANFGEFTVKAKPALVRKKGRPEVPSAE